MTAYLVRRLLLLPPTLFFILLVNFVIINLAPGDPTTVTEISPEGDAARRASASVAFGSDQRYLQFREFYGLTLPILFNNWPVLTEQDVLNNLNKLSKKDLSIKEYDALRVETGDQARFVLPKLLAIMQNPSLPKEVRELAAKFFVRGGTKQAITDPNLTEQERLYNEKIAKDNRYLLENIGNPQALAAWYAEHPFNPDFIEKIKLFFFETRFFKYMSRVVTLDFGTMRNDPNKTVISEVAKRLKYSLTLSIVPMFITFFLCQLFGFYMAYKQGQLSDKSLNLVFLVLYAIPIFVAAPFLIEKVAFPFHIPFSGFTSPEQEYQKMTSLQRLFDILKHLMLPFVAIMYGSLAAQTRLSRTAVLEVMRQDYVRTARAKGLSTFQVFFKHIGRNAGITIVTSLAASLGAILGGTLIVETLFEINGFGKFFYDAILNRDFNVILFSALAGSFLALAGYLVADLFYMLLDPRVRLDKEG